jgi:hypothetical protein
LFAQLQQSLEAQRQAYGEIEREAWRALLSTRADFNYRSNVRGVFKIAGDMWPAETERVLYNGEVFAGVDTTYPDHYRLAVPVRVPSGDIVGVIDTYSRRRKGNGRWMRKHCSRKSQNVWGGRWKAPSSTTKASAGPPANS